MRFPQFGALIVGDEILSGKREDKHLRQLIALLGARGWALSWADYVGDDPARLTAALQRAWLSGDVVFSFGGIGATPDDHTRQCAAAALGVPLALHPDAVALIQERMQDVAREQGQVYAPERPDNVHRLQMGNFPVGAHIIPNPYNKIPGFYCERPQGGALYCVPGFPVMAWPMVEWVLDGFYARQQPCGNYEERSAILPGAMEATLTPLMQQIERQHPGVKVFSLPSVDHAEHGRHVELGVKGQVEAVAPAWDDLLQGLHLIGAHIKSKLVHKR